MMRRLCPTHSQVVQWRGTWVLMDQLLSFPESSSNTTASFAIDPLALSGLASLAIGIAGLAAAVVIQAILSLCPCGRGPPVASRLRCVGVASLERVYAYFLGFCTINFWRGVWVLCDVYVLPKHPLSSALATHFIGTIVLLLSGHLMSVPGPPFLVTPDGRSEPCEAGNKHPEGGAEANVYAVIKAVVCCWRDCCTKENSAVSSPATNTSNIEVGT